MALYGSLEGTSYPGLALTNFTSPASHRMEQRESLVPNVLFPDLHNAGLLWMRVSPQKQPQQPEDLLMFEGQTRRSQSKNMAVLKVQMIKHLLTTGSSSSSTSTPQAHLSSSKSVASKQLVKVALILCPASKRPPWPSSVHLYVL